MKKFISILILALISFSAVAQEFVTVSPTWKEAGWYARHSAFSQTGWSITGWVLIAVAIAIVVMGAKNMLTWLGKSHATVVSIAAFILLVFGVACFHSKRAAVWLNNKKKVEKTHFEKVGRKHILDSCFYNNLMIDAAVKK